ncbi:MAG: ATP synthase F1 subunit delta [Acidobacteria bacterium]|nr:ATP synthase F1 subunit delta [Acidobacteriota bacterium]NIO60562.1 ATP synthase F1 subunit delta [Acidobacteriota bacterium]NIT12232.1 ATP synthase F1 subunit delta [Acidobacteriota bacterium]
MIGGSVARRYARALLAIGQEEGHPRRILEEAERFKGLVAETPLLREMMEAAHINRRDKKAALEASLRADGLLPSTRNFLFLLVDKGRMNLLSPIVSELRRLIEQMEGIERVEVSVPFPLTGTQRDLLQSALERETGKKVLLEEKVDPDVLGGMVVKVGSTVYDGSARAQIQRIRETLEKG